MEKISASSKYCCFTNGGLMFTQLGSEFMPPLDEGSILFMPVTCLMFLIQNKKEYRFRTN
jgi:Cu/Ag efflux pump CusA